MSAVREWYKLQKVLLAEHRPPLESKRQKHRPRVHNTHVGVVSSLCTHHNFLRGSSGVGLRPVCLEKSYIQGGDLLRCLPSGGAPARFPKRRTPIGLPPPGTPLPAQPRSGIADIPVCTSELPKFGTIKISKIFTAKPYICI
jgi:hypothetical protein